MSVVGPPLPHTKGPVKPYRRIVIEDSGDQGYTTRLLVGTAVTGLVRVEWVQARFGQVIPINWSMTSMWQFLSGYMPLRWQVANAQNLIVKQAIEAEYEWLLLWEHDVLPPADGLLKINQWIHDERVPVVSGLYYTRSRPSEPLVFRGRGTSYFDDWEHGDMVWLDGVPTGFLLVHVGLLKAMWDESPEYVVNNQVVRRVFQEPRYMWIDERTGHFNSITGTSDLDWCSKVIEGGYLAKAGWDEYADREWPFLVDTTIFCKHINADGTQFP